MLGSCLDALVRMDFPAEDREVILVDNNSNDETVAIASRYREALNLTIAHAGGYISAVRNHGAGLATGDLIAFLDADCAPAQDWLSCAIQEWAPGRVVGAYYGIPPGSSWVAKAWYGHDHREKTGCVPFIPSGDLIISREAFLQVGGFDETIETNEDYEFCQRALAAGMEITACTSLAVTHFGTPQTLGEFYRKQHWHGKAVMKVTFRQLGSFKNARAVSFAMYTFACLGSAVLGLGMGLLSGNYFLVAGSLTALVLAPLALGTRLAIRRRELGELVPLFLLFLAYGIARAHCMADVTVPFRKTS